ncbi:MAG: hypothetical protein ACRDTU_15380 [Micromonosporaceae bacterium]
MPRPSASGTAATPVGVRAPAGRTPGAVPARKTCVALRLDVLPKWAVLSPK